MSMARIDHRSKHREGTVDLLREASRLVLTLASRSCIDRKSGGKLAMRSDLYRVQHVCCKVLTIVAYKVVPGFLGAHVMDSHLACGLR